MQKKSFTRLMAALLVTVMIFTSVPTAAVSAKARDAKTETSVESETISGAEKSPEAEATPEIDPTPEVELTPTAEPTPKVEESPTAEPTPEVEATPTAEPTPEVDVTPTAKPTPEVESTPTAESTPEVETPPTAEPTPGIEETPTAVPTALPSVQPSQTPEDKKPDVRDIIKHGLRLFSMAKSADDFYAGGSTFSHTFKKGDSELSEGFESAKVSVTNKKGGYNNADVGEDRNVRFSFELVMDNDFLYEQIEAVSQRIDYPMQGRNESDADYENRVNDYLNALTDIPELKFTYSLGDGFSDISKQQGIIKDSSGAEFGTYVVERGKMTVTLLNETYAYQGVYANFSFDAQLDADVTKDDGKVETDFKDGKIIHRDSGSITGGGSEGEDKEYQLEKQAPNRVTTSTVDYTVKATAPVDDGMLNGKTFVDILPAGLEVLSVSLDGNKLSEAQYRVENGELKYNFPKKTDVTAEIKTAEFAITLALDTAEYQKLITDNKYSNTFSNKAELRDTDTGDKIKESNSVDTSMSLSYIKKDGAQDDLKGMNFSWKIDINTRLQRLDYGYVVDQLCSSYHKYDFNKGITVSGKNGTTVYSNANGNITYLQSSGAKWNDITASGLKGLIGNTSNAVYYEYDSGAANPFYTPGGDEPEFLQLGVLVLPFTGLQGTDKDENVKISYGTSLNLHGMNMDEYLLHSGSATVKIDNVVNLVWENKTGTGVGPGNRPQPDSVSLGKEVDTKIDIMEKKGISYNPKTGLLNWKLIVNKMGAKLNNAFITDTLPKGTYSGNSNDVKITYVKYNAGSDSDVVVSQGILPNTAQTDKAFYDLTTPSTAADGEIKITIPEELTAGYYYVFNINLKLDDGAMLSTQKTHVLKNTASISADVNNVPKSSTDEAELNIPNTLIKKKVVDSYNYKTNELFWEVEINPNSLNINNAIIKDTLPVGTSFEKTQLLQVKVDGVEDGALLQAIKDNTTIDAVNRIVTFDIGNITKPITLKLATTITQAFRDSADFVESGTAFKNEAELNGTLINGGGESFPITDAKADATQTVRSGHMTKGGKYNKDEGYIDWSVLINLDQKDVTGTTFSEDLYETKDDGTKLDKLVHELRMGSVKLCEVSIDAGGKPTDGANISLDSLGFDETVSGFKFNMPVISGTVNNKVYRVVFRTDLVGDDANAKINNTVYLKGFSNGSTDSSNTSDGGYQGGFKADEAAGRNPRPKISISKTSSNSVDNDTQDKNLPLDEAEFVLEAYKITAPTAGNEISFTNNAASLVKKYEKVRLTSDGTATFLNVVAADDLVYRLHESNAPGGYETDGTPTFFYFPITDTGNDKITVKETKDGTETSYSGSQVVNPKTEDGNITYGAGSVTIQNTPSADSKFSFTKMQPDTYSYSTSEAVTYKYLAGAIFRLEPTGSLVGKVQNKFATSDGSGTVSFENLDPGTYKLTEIKSGTNLAVGGSCTLEVKWDEATSKYTHTLTGTGLSYEKDIDGKYTVKNDFVRGSFAVNKLVKFTDSAFGSEDETKNKERLLGAEFKIKGKVGGAAADNYERDFTTDKNGKPSPSFSLPVGDYTLTETSAPDGYVKSSVTFDVKVTEETDTNIKWQDKDGNNVFGKKAVVAITNGGTAVTNGEIHNTPIKGTISFNKVAYWGDSGLTALNKPLPNVSFGLYRKTVTTNGNGGNVTYTAVAPTYTAAPSGVNGEVSFANVEYGDYVLKEINPPKGYNIFSKDIKRSDFTISADKLSFTYAIGTDVQNVIRRYPSLSFQKTNSDGVPKETVSETIQKNIFTITVKNEKDIPVEPTPTNTPTDKPAPTVSPSQAPSTKPATSANPSSPTTGDSGNTVLWLIAFSALAVTIILLMKRKRERY